MALTLAHEQKALSESDRLFFCHRHVRKKRIHLEAVSEWGFRFKVPQCCPRRSQSHGDVAAEEEPMGKCRQAYDTYRFQIPWLCLTDSGRGCRICMAFETKRNKSGLASGTFVPGRYLYKRTFLSHETSCRVHGEATACQSSRPPAPQECASPNAATAARGSRAWGDVDRHRFEWA